MNKQKPEKTCVSPGLSLLFRYCPVGSRVAGGITEKPCGFNTVRAILDLPPASRNLAGRSSGLAVLLDASRQPTTGHSECSMFRAMIRRNCLWSSFVVESAECASFNGRRLPYSGNKDAALSHAWKHSAILLHGGSSNWDRWHTSSDDSLKGAWSGANHKALVKAGRGQQGATKDGNLWSDNRVGLGERRGGAYGPKGNCQEGVPARRSK